MALTTSCASKRKVYEKVTERDSISYAVPLQNTLVIENLCDTIKSPLNVFKTSDSGVIKTTVELKNNKLTVITKTDTIFKEVIKYRDRVQTKEVVRQKIPIWVWLSYVIMFIVIVGYIRFRRFF